MDHEIEVSERHPFRFLVKLMLLVGVVYFASRFVAEQKKEFSGLTESEARSKLVDKIGSKIGDDTANEIADQVIPKLKEKGFVKADPAEKVADVAKAAAKEVADAAEDAADKVSEAVDSVVKD
jgi:hypothetical protein